MSGFVTFTHRSMIFSIEILPSCSRQQMSWSAWAANGQPNRSCWRWNVQWVNLHCKSRTGNQSQINVDVDANTQRDPQSYRTHSICHQICIIKLAIIIFNTRCHNWTTLTSHDGYVMNFLIDSGSVKWNAKVWMLDWINVWGVFRFTHIWTF